MVVYQKMASNFYGNNKNVINNTLITVGVGAGTFFLLPFVVSGVCTSIGVGASGPVAGGTFAAWQAGTGGAIAAGSTMAGIQSVAMAGVSTTAQVVASGVTSTIAYCWNRKS